MTIERFNTPEWKLPASHPRSVLEPLIPDSKKIIKALTPHSNWGKMGWQKGDAIGGATSHLETHTKMLAWSLNYRQLTHTYHLPEEQWMLDNAARHFKPHDACIVPIRRNQVELWFWTGRTR